MSKLLRRLPVLDSRPARPQKQPQSESVSLRSPPLSSQRIQSIIRAASSCKLSRRNVLNSRTKYYRRGAPGLNRIRARKVGGSNRPSDVRLTRWWRTRLDLFWAACSRARGSVSLQHRTANVSEQLLFTSARPRQLRPRCPGCGWSSNSYRPTIRHWRPSRCAVRSWRARYPRTPSTSRASCSDPARFRP